MAKAKKIEAQEPNTDAPLGAGVEEMTLDSNNAGGGEDLTELLGNLESELSGGAVIAGAISETPPAGMPTAAAADSTNSLEADLALLDSTLDSDSGATTATTPADPAPAATPAEPAGGKRISTMGLKTSEALLKALGSRANEFLIINVSDADLKPAQQQAKITALLDEIDNNTPIKIKEKVTNLYAHIANNATLSTYTQMAIFLLVKDGELTSKSLKDAYLAHPYADGTASSQTTQMMKLLPLLGLAVRNGSKLTVNADSMLLPILSAK